MFTRCVVCRDGVALEMSQDHKPEEEVEARRIVAAGGKVTSEGRVNGGLNLSRAIGDHSYKQNSTLPLKDQMITSLPDVEYALLNPLTDKFLVLACDGIWNSMTSQQVVDFVGERIKNPKLKLSDICEQVSSAVIFDNYLWSIQIQYSNNLRRQIATLLVKYLLKY
jgi:protein phosphatase 1G